MARPSLTRFSTGSSRTTHAGPRRERIRRVATVAMSLGLLSARDWGGPALRASSVGARPPQTPAGLWIASTSAPALLRLAPAQLVEDGHVSPASVVTPRGIPLHSLVGAAFDTAGRLWITDQGDSLLLALSPVELDAPASPAVASIITATARSLSAPVGLAFDARNRLWVANFGNGTLVRFDPAQLAATGAPAPAVVIAGLHRPTALAFDAAGSLWVSDMKAQTIVAYGADQLEASGTPAPRVRIAVTGDTLAAPAGLAFDAPGNLWVVNVGNGTVVGFGAAQLAASGVRAPQVSLAMHHAGSAGAPAGLAFDDAGNLWVVELDGIVSKFTRDQLVASGTPTPSVSVTLDDHALLWGAAFWPRPRGLPLH